MKRDIITIGENGKVHIPTAPVWMSACEIASLFGVFSGKVNSHIKSVFKEGLLREDEVMQTLSFKGGAVDLYNIEMIMMLSFRFVSPPPRPTLPQMGYQETYPKEIYHSAACMLQ